MLSLTAVKIKIKKTHKAAILFALGVSVVVIGQSYIAVGFSKLLMNNSENIILLRKWGTWLFVILSIFFFYNAKKAKKPVEKKKKLTGGFASGFLLSTVNMFAIPYYFGITSALAMEGWYQFSPFTNISFVIGSFVGTFLLLYTYILLADKLLKKLKRIFAHMDLILAILTGTIAIINTVDLYL